MRICTSKHPLAANPRPATPHLRPFLIRLYSCRDTTAYSTINNRQSISRTSDPKVSLLLVSDSFYLNHKPVHRRWKKAIGKINTSTPRSFAAPDKSSAKPCATSCAMSCAASFTCRPRAELASPTPKRAEDSYFWGTDFQLL